MFPKRLLRVVFPALLIIAALSCQKESQKLSKSLSVAPPSASNAQSNDQTVPVVRVFSTGLYNPRGLKFGPDGYLYVAEGGIGGTHSTVGLCTQVPFPVGPYFGSPTGARISRINKWGLRTTFADNFPSSHANEIIGGDVEGVADVAFIGKQMYALLAGAGCSHGVPSMPNGVVKVHHDGSWSLIADLSSWLMAHPVANPEPDDFEPDGTPYSMINVHGNLYAVEPNHGDFVKINPRDGNITRVVDISASQGHIVPTVVAFDKNFFIGNLHPFPIVGGSSKILKVSPSGNVSDWATGLTTILGLVIDEEDNVYVLENTAVAFSPTPLPGKGAIIKINRDGVKSTLVGGLNFPTGITIGPDGNLYVSNVGFGPISTGGGGQVLQINLRHEVHEREDDKQN